MKRKVLSLLLLFVMLLGLTAFPLSISAESYTLTQKILSCKIAPCEIYGTVLDVSFLVKNNTDSIVKATAYAALYNEDGILKDAGVSGFSINPDFSTTLGHTFINYTYSENDYVKIFLWDENYEPLSLSAESIINANTLEGIILETTFSSNDYNGTDYVTFLVTGSNTDSYTIGNTYEFIDNVDVNDYLGYSTVITVSDNTIIDAKEKADTNKLITIDTELISNFSESIITYYESETSKYSTTASLAPEVDVVINGINYDNYASLDVIFNSIRYIDNITILNNDSDSEYEFIFAHIPDVDSYVEFVVESVDSYEGYYYFEGSSQSIDIDSDSSYRNTRIFKDGEKVTPDKICVGDTITCLDASLFSITIYVSSLKVEGWVEEIDDGTYYINDIGYKLSALSYVRNIEVGAEALFYINAFGKIVNLEALVKPEYVYVTDAHAADPAIWGDVSMLRVVTTSGEIETPVIKESKVYVVTPSGYEEYLTATEAIEKHFSSYRGLIKIETDDSGKITAIYLPGANQNGFIITDNRYANDTTAQISRVYNEKLGRYGIITLSPDTVVYNIDPDPYLPLVDRVSVSTVGDYFIDNSTYSFTAYYSDVEEPADVLVVTDSLIYVEPETPETDDSEIPEPIASEAPVTVVSKVTRTSAQGETALKIYGISAGAEVEVILDPDYYSPYSSPCTAGDVIMYTMINGFATDVQVLLSEEELATNLDEITCELSDTKVSIHYSKITEKESAYIILNGYDTPFYFADTVNITVVDCTGREMVISAGSLVDLNPSFKASITKKAFVKTVADETDIITDAVVFITTP